MIKRLSCEKLGCTIGGIYYKTIFYADDIVLLDASACKMQKMIDIYYKYRNKYGTTLNPAKTNWIYINVCNNVLLNINGIVIQNIGLSIKYLSVNLIVCYNMLTIDVQDRIHKFNMAVYDVLLNTSNLNKIIRFELIVKKCLPVLQNRICDVSITNRDTYRLHIAYRKIYGCIFKMSLRASVEDLLNVFYITPIVELIENKTRTFMRQGLESRYIELQIS